MKELNGLWKDKDYGLLLQLHGVKVLPPIEPSTIGNGFMSFRATARVVKGKCRVMKHQLLLVSVLPKQDVTINILDANKRGHISMWNIEGIVVCSKTIANMILCERREK